MANNDKSKAKPTTPTWFNFTSAGIGGILAWIVIHPFNTGLH
jgi:hypothetical protein